MPEAGPNLPDHSLRAPRAASNAEFYVGYLGMPPRMGRFIRRLIPSALLVSTAVGWLLARAQNDPGNAVWSTASPREFVGIVEAAPYPHLRVRSSTAEGAVETLLLVEVGKFGGGARAARLSGRGATISGWVLERDGRRMLEMEPGPSLKEAALPTVDAARLSRPRTVGLGPVSLCGEIIDSKCYLGAMKPGEGKTHKECATLCIAGGIPPMLVTIDAAGQRRYFLLTDPAGEALDERILPYAGDAVEIRGELESRDDLTILRMDPANLRRL